MADIVKLLALVAGAPDSIDLPDNTGVWLSLKVGGGVSNTELTKAILDNLITLQNGSDIAASLHHHDGRYFTETELGSVAGALTSGASKIGVFLTATNYTAANPQVEAHLAGINTALGAVAGNNSFNDNLFNIYNNVDNDKIMKFNAGNITAFTTRVLTMADFDTDLGALVNANISASAAIDYSKLNLALSIVNADINASAAIAYSKLDLAGSIVNADIAAGAAIAVNKLAAQTAGRALISDGSGFITVSPVTSTTLAFLDATSSVQTQLNARELSANKGVAGGYAPLDGGGKIPSSFLPNTVMELQGFWNANTNTPTLADGVGNPGDIWEADVAGTTDFGNGPITFAVGDWAVYAADGMWHKSLNSNAVTSVNGFTGTVVLSTTDIAEGSNEYFTVERAQDAVGSAFLATTTITLSYDDLNNQISADINALSITNALISATAAIDFSKLANLVSGNILVGSAGNVATSVAMSGEASIIASGAVTLSNAAVIAKLLTGFVSGAGTVTASDSILSAIQKIDGNDQLKIPLTQKGAANGVATLDAGTKIPAAQLPDSVMELKNTWNANTNTPTLADGVGNVGDVYRVTVAGTQDLGSGSQVFVVNDWVYYDTTGVWLLAHTGADAAAVVNAINELTGDATAGPAVGSQSVALTLATVNANVGTFGSASMIPTVTVNAKGLVTAASQAAPAYYRAGQQAIGNAATSQAITFSSTLGTTNYAPTVVMRNVTDANPQFQDVVITAKTATGFTVSWNSPTDSGNYILEFTAFPNV